MLNIHVFFFVFAACTFLAASSVPDKARWGYLEVRKGAHMFWLLEPCRKCNPSSDGPSPLIIWLQGGPGASGVGYGNFQEIGPYGLNWRPRKHSWVEAADVLFLDNPVGTGFSYVEDSSLYTKTNSEIAADLVAFMREFLRESPAFVEAPLFIFCESYGGKMGMDFAEKLLDAQQDGTIQSNLKGLALGDSWVSPVDFVMAWGPVLYAWSLLDDTSLANITQLARQTEDALLSGNGTLSTQLWGVVEEEVMRQTDDVDFYNMLLHNVPDDDAINELLYLDAADLPPSAQRHLLRTHPHNLKDFMETSFRRRVGIIPPNVTWGGQSGKVFKHLTEDFMKDAIPTFDKLMEAGFPVTVYSGQLDLICCTLGLDMWLDKSTWGGLRQFQQSPRTTFHIDQQPGRTAGFVKSYKSLVMYTLMGAGHMVPADQPLAALAMVRQVLADHHGGHYSAE